MRIPVALHDVQRSLFLHIGAVTRYASNPESFKSPVGDISVVTLIRTDTTLDHKQKAEKVFGIVRISGRPPETRSVKV